jgi:hypothetical protein
MACRNCKSDWLTLRGRDCNTCPHCNKLQRCVERKRGRWTDPQETKPCKQCGKTFTCKNFGSPLTKVYCSSACRELGKAEWRRKWRSGYRAGVRKQKQRKRHGPRPTCKECGKQFKRQKGSNSSNIYCSKACFFVARASGKQSWDKTNIRKASWHIGGWYANAPSVRLMKRIAKAHTFVATLTNCFERFAAKELSKVQCEHCGAACKEGRSRFCSYACVKAWRGTRQCEICGSDVPSSTSFSKCRCHACRATLRKEATRRGKRKYGRNHRQRARRAGVSYVSIPVRAIYERDCWRCQICRRKCQKAFMVSKKDGRPHPRSPTLDHIKSLRDGGNHEPSNVQLACFECNTRKGAASRGQLRLEFM